MAKKRRVTPDQARLMAIVLLQIALGNELQSGTQHIPDDIRKELWYFKDALPPKWSDGLTSDQSWDQLWEEMSLQMTIILKGLDREALRIRVENPEFRYETLYPTNGKPKVAV